MDDRTILDRVRNLIRKSDADQDYEAIDTENEGYVEDVRRPILVVSDARDRYSEDNDEEGEAQGEPFSWFEYSIFILLGVVMLWAW